MMNQRQDSCLIRIKIFCPFATTQQCKEIFERINESALCNWYGEQRGDDNKEAKRYLFVSEKDNNYTHAIIINTAMPQLIPSVPKENVLGLAFEPVYFLGLHQAFIEYAKQHIGKYLIGDSSAQLPSLFVEHFGYMWYSNPHIDIALSDKPNCMSIVLSEKKITSGHKYRHVLVDHIIKHNLPIDIYGRGAHKYGGPRCKGVFTDDEPYRSYLFTICIENVVSNHYFSEKVISPALYNCMPVYYGCKHIHSYLDNVIVLTGVPEHDLETICSILQNPMQYYQKTYTKKNRETVSLIHHLPDFF